MEKSRQWTKMVVGLGMAAVGTVVIGIVAWQTWQQPVTLISPEGKPVVVRQVEEFLRRPESSVPVYLESVDGGVKLIPWDRPDEVSATAGARLYQGDGLRVSTGSARMRLGEKGEIDLGAETEVVWASLQPTTQTLKQTGGRVEWRDTGTWALRVGTAAVQIESGSGRVVANPWRLDVTVGEARVGYLDASGLTKVWRVRAGQWLTIDDGRRRVRTTGGLEASY